MTCVLERASVFLVDSAKDILLLPACHDGYKEFVLCCGLLAVPFFLSLLRELYQ